MTRYRFRDTAMCRTVMTLPDTYYVSVPLSYPCMSRTTHGVRIYSCVKLRSSLIQLLVAKLHTRGLSIPSPHTSPMPDLVFICSTHLVLHDMMVHACMFCGQRYLIGYSTVATIFRSIVYVVLVSPVHM